MIRTQIYITEEEKKGLEAVANSQGVSQSNLIRQAIDNFLARTGKFNKIALLDEIAGIWSDKNDIPDIRDLRTGWQRRLAR